MNALLHERHGQLSVYVIDMLHVQDDYNFVLRDEQRGLTAVFDPSEADGIIAFLEGKGWQLDYILNTHHHWDHTNGNPGLKARYDCTVVGAKADAHRIKAIDVMLEDNASFQFGDFTFETFDVSGHTMGHIAWYCPQAGILFPGDTLFAMGCGRMFEGTPAQFHASLGKIAALPDDTIIYPSHEYTIPNGRFARKMEPDNAVIDEHIEWARQRLRQKLPSIPTTLAREKATNPFLRTHSPTIRKQLAMADANEIEIFAALRAAKDAS